MGDSIAASEGQVVFHIPITGTKTGVEHVGSNIVIFNTSNNLQVLIKNPVIDLKNGVVKAVVPQASADAITLFTITNAKELKAKITNDKKAKLRTTSYEGAKLSLAPGLGLQVLFRFWLFQKDHSLKLWHLPAQTFLSIRQSRANNSGPVKT